MLQIILSREQSVLGPPSSAVHTTSSCLAPVQSAQHIHFRISVWVNVKKTSVSLFLFSYTLTEDEKQSGGSLASVSHYFTLIFDEF